MPEYPETKRMPCRCGGKAVLLIAESKQILGERVYSVFCEDCRIRTDYFPSAQEACEAWNKVMGDQTAVVINAHGNYDAEGHPLLVSGACGNCDNPVIMDDKYCSECGFKLDWSGK